VTPLYRWDGRYVGFRLGDHLYTPSGEAFGWVDEDETAWHSDGRYLGEIFEDNYILRAKRLNDRSRRTRRRMQPTRPMRAFAVPNRQARMATPGADDGLAWLSDP
jgi:hypothetical protein